MPNGGIVIVLLVAIVIVVIIIPMANKAKEGFMSIYDYSRQDYIEHGKSNFNKLANTANPLKPSFVNSQTEYSALTANEEIQAATVTAGIKPNPDSLTFLGVEKKPTNYTTSPGNSVLLNAKQCETVTTRNACARLGESNFRDCGVCIKGGTRQDGTNPGGHIGGMLLLEEDRETSIEMARGTRAAPQFTPTIGTCPPGSFFADRASCDKAVNRAECKESGETGGFSGKTIEGRVISKEKCAQVPSSGDNVFIYDPKNRMFPVNLRVTVPSGTGVNYVMVYDYAGREIGRGGVEGGTQTEFLVRVNRVKEQDEVTIKVFQEVPYRRPGGKAEVFQYKHWDSPTPKWHSQTKASAAAICDRMGSRQATKEEVYGMWRNGAQACSCGWTTTDLVYPMQSEYRDGYDGHNGWCGSKNVNSCGVGVKNLGQSWCYGVKPPNSSNLADFNKSAEVVPWFQSLGKNSDPSQDGQPNIWSAHGADYQAPFARGVILQWEGIDDAKDRMVPFEPSITGVNGMDLSNVAGDGTKTFKILRRQGTFNASKIIQSPRPRRGGPMISNQFWIWSNQAKSATLSFRAKVPGTLAAPFYPEDRRGVSTAGPIIAHESTMQLLRTSPCLRDGENSGSYSHECLTSLFVSAGGDSGRGKLATTGLGLANLNKIGDMDAIAEYLNNIYTLATTGRDAEGNVAGGADSARRVAVINEAAQKLFGFDIATPCEDIAEDAKGNVIVMPKTSGISADCLQYLWVNTGADRNRGSEDPSSMSSLKHTYTDIRDRFSGLLKKEGSPASQKKYPFRTCQSSGSLAPIDAKGNINASSVAMAITRGGIRQIQDFYDGIHRTANNLSMSKSTEGEKQFSSAVEMCYGVVKAAEESGETNCGVMARYVRVLPNGIYPSHEHGNLCIQIPQIQVFDTEDNEVAKGKPTSAGTLWHAAGSEPERAVDGKAYPHGHDSEYHDTCDGPDNQFWIVDLGREYNITRVKYFIRTECCKQRQIATPVQLLNSAKEIVAQKHLYQDVWPNWGGDTSTLVFTKNDAKPEYTINQLTPGLRFSAMTATSFDRYLRHYAAIFYAQNTDNKHPSSLPAPFPLESTFIIAPANNGKSGYISIASASHPNYYLRHSGYRCYLNTFDHSEVYKDDSSFKIVPALNGDIRMTSFQSSNFPSHYLSTARANPGEIWISTVNNSSAYDLQRASWMITRPNA